KRSADEKDELLHERFDPVAGGSSIGWDKIGPGCLHAAGDGWQTDTGGKGETGGGGGQDGDDGEQVHGRGGQQYMGTAEPVDEMALHGSGDGITGGEQGGGATGDG